jgi:hypothetical protein
LAAPGAKIFITWDVHMLNDCGIIMLLKIKLNMRYDDIAVEVSLEKIIYKINTAER